MGKRDRQWREPKKPKKGVQKPVAVGAPPPPAAVEVIKKKRKERTTEE